VVNSTSQIAASWISDSETYAVVEVDSTGIILRAIGGFTSPDHAETWAENQIVGRFSVVPCEVAPAASATF
jgi:hypothetical protein